MEPKDNNNSSPDTEKYFENWGILNPQELETFRNYIASQKAYLLNRSWYPGVENGCRDIFNLRPKEASSLTLQLLSDAMAMKQTESGPIAEYHFFDPFGSYLQLLQQFTLPEMRSILLEKESLPADLQRRLIERIHFSYGSLYLPETFIPLCAELKIDGRKLICTQPVRDITVATIKRLNKITSGFPFSPMTPKNVESKLDFLDLYLGADTAKVRDIIIKSLPYYLISEDYSSLTREQKGPMKNVTHDTFTYVFPNLALTAEEFQEARDNAWGIIESARDSAKRRGQSEINHSDIKKARF